MDLKKLNLYAAYTPSHEVLVKNWFLPSLDRNEFKLSLIKEKQIGKGVYGNSDFNKSTLYKISHILKAVKENWGGLFVFSDVDIIFLGKIKDVLLKEIDKYDIVFEKNNICGEINTGFFICKANEKTLRFWTDVGKKAKSLDIHDQAAANLLLIDSAFNSKNRSSSKNLIIKNIYKFSLNYCFPTTNLTYHLLPLLTNKYKLKWSYLPNNFFCPSLLGIYDWKPGINIKLPKNILMHHANWTIGIKNKILQLKYIKKLYLNQK